MKSRVGRWLNFLVEQVNDMSDRRQYRGCLKTDLREDTWSIALEEARQVILEMIRNQILLTASLYRHGNLCFLYYEALELELLPEQFLESLTPFLELWPEENGMMPWAYMYQIFYHSIPEKIEDWECNRAGKKSRIGRIAFLYPEKLFSYTYWHKAIMDGIRIQNNDRGPNNDGIDPDCCKNVVIRGCIIESGDDSIVVKATKPMQKKYGDCENIIIQGCVMHSRDSALKIGTETHGNIRNVILSDCVICDCTRAIGIWVRDGGTVEDIYIHHLTGNTLRYAGSVPQAKRTSGWWGKGEPIFISATRRKGVDKLPGKIRNITLEHIRLKAESCIFIGGEEYARIENIRLEKMDITWRQQGKHTPDVFDEQPSARDVYRHEIPCLYARHVDGLLVRGQFGVEDTLKEVIRTKEILEECINCRIEIEEQRY